MDEGLDLGFRGKLLAQVGDVASEVRTAVLQRGEESVIAGVAVHDGRTPQALRSEDFLRDLRGAREAKAEETEVGRAEDPGVAILSVGAPAGLVGLPAGRRACRTGARR